MDANIWSLCLYRPGLFFFLNNIRVSGGKKATVLKTAVYFAELWLIFFFPSSIYSNIFNSSIVLQMEDGHTIFDYNVGLNDIVQLLVRQALPGVSLPKDKEAELSDSDSGCGSGQSDSDKSSTHGECEGQSAGTSAQSDLINPGFGLYKVKSAVNPFLIGCLHLSCTTLSELFIT